ncbi:peptidyl-prolyl cis-trans isomerase-like 2 [Sporothrix brasiliensis 5110]|uniref:Peptidyl-prolyl cis-trans isomerase-like 2 n=1 Tax=Sporothrix brasiliensis 5110 TaxID=1398154 RepID=A0A0C2IX63_9PEZI|nr:peptidyl-prolyl cis-trans isomerase-like 2 [Sporothrix brasiliensis 5110]KIH93696.1 peptidyl-prolyl cis-trans isomerase-like 2 [Sporothrix brasiliensis 5110]
MGKGTDKLYITHSEWASADSFGASKGAAGRSGLATLPNHGAAFRRLPFNYCAASLQPFQNPVCTPDGTIFDAEVIAAWLDKQKPKPGTNPVTGAPLKASDLIKLNFARNDADGSHDLIDPVTFKVFSDNTHIVAVRHGTYANVFAWDTIERMNVKPRMWLDLMDDAPFTRKDIITLQDPQNMTGRDMSQFQFVKDGKEAAPAPGGQKGTDDADGEEGDGSVNVGALGRMGEKMLRAKEAVDKARRARDAGGDVNRSASTAVARTGSGNGALAASSTTTTTTSNTSRSDLQRKPAYNAATYTTGRAAASFTSTGLTPETSGERAVLSDEEWMLKPRRIKNKGYARIETNVGHLNIALQTEFAPKAVWNFVRLAQTGYYRNVAFHRNIRNFMIQGGDPTGTGRGGTSIWGKTFADELEGPLTHSARGVVSMANKGKDTNSSQFFITYRAAKHLDRKHTIFGQVVDGLDVLDRMETAPVDKAKGDRPIDDIVIHDVVVYVDPFDEFLSEKRKADKAEEKKAEIQRRGGTDDDKMTWTGKRLRGTDDGASGGSSSVGVGTYLKQALVQQQQQVAAAADDDASLQQTPEAWEEPVRKKAKSGGFGNFDSW